MHLDFLNLDTTNTTALQGMIMGLTVSTERKGYCYDVISGTAIQSKKRLLRCTSKLSKMKSY